MSDASGTLRRYESECRAVDRKPNKYIIKMLTLEEESLLKRGNEEAGYRLHLAGDNHLMMDPKTSRLTDSDIKPLFHSLWNNFFVEFIDLRYNRLTGEGGKIVAKLLEENTYLRGLNLMGNDIGPDGAIAIAKALQGNETLQDLQLTGNKIGEKGGMAFAQMLQVNKSLLRLDLCDCDLTIQCLVAIATVLNFNETLRCLNLNKPLLWTVQEEPLVHIGEMLMRNKGLKELNLEKFPIRDFGLDRLTDALFTNRTITHLDLSSNRITRDGVKYLCKALKTGIPLEFLDLSNNRLEDPGALHLADALVHEEVNLKVLSVRFNQIRGEGLCAIVDSLKENTGLKQFYAWGNIWDTEACVAFDSLIRYGRLTLDDVDIKPYVVDGVTFVSELFQQPRRHYYYAPFYGADVPEFNTPFGDYKKLYTDQDEQLNELIYEQQYGQQEDYGGSWRR